jgi:hypothetical protein
MVDHALQYVLVDAEARIRTTGGVNEPLVARTAGPGCSPSHAEHLWIKDSPAPNPNAHGLMVFSPS